MSAILKIRLASEVALPKLLSSADPAAPVAEWPSSPIPRITFERDHAVIVDVEASTAIR